MVATGGCRRQCQRQHALAGRFGVTLIAYPLQPAHQFAPDGHAPLPAARLLGCLPRLLLEELQVECSTHSPPGAPELKLCLLAACAAAVCLRVRAHHAPRGLHCGLKIRDPACSKVGDPWQQPWPTPTWRITGALPWPCPSCEGGGVNKLNAHPLICTRQEGMLAVLRQRGPRHSSRAAFLAHSRRHQHQHCVLLQSH